MFSQTLATHINVSPANVDALLNLTPEELYESPEFVSILESLDPELLRDTLQEARSVLDDDLPALVDDFMNHYHIDHFPLTSYMVGNWVVGFATYPSELVRLPQIHANIPIHIIREAAPHILDMLENMADGKKHWQKAFATMCLFVGMETEYHQ